MGSRVAVFLGLLNDATAALNLAWKTKFTKNDTEYATKEQEKTQEKPWFH